LGESEQSEPDKTSVAIWGDSGWSTFLKNSKGVNSTRVALLDVELVNAGLLERGGDETGDEGAKSIGLESQCDDSWCENVRCSDFERLVSFPVHTALTGHRLEARGKF
jgi:hypothetical protein